MATKPPKKTKTVMGPGGRYAILDDKDNIIESRGMEWGKNEQGDRDLIFIPITKGKSPKKKK